MWRKPLCERESVTVPIAYQKFNQSRLSFEIVYDRLKAPSVNALTKQLALFTIALNRIGLRAPLIGADIHPMNNDLAPSRLSAVRATGRFLINV
tara:strand:+ start:918 stop:1199 length:282 start_codon:yes stop_codon:yes gene_type:complete